MGHTERIVPAKFVKPYVKSNKNDIIDAEAIAEAVTRPTMRFVEIRSAEQVDLQALHRVRDRLVAQRTRVICQMRAFCLEYGIAMHQGAGKFKADLPRVVADEENDLSPAMRRLLTELFDDVKTLEAGIKEVTGEIEAVAAADDTARRLMTVQASGRLPRQPCWRRPAGVCSSERRATWQPGSASCRGNTRPAARRPCSASASEGARI